MGDGPYRQIMESRSAGGTYDDLETPPVPEGHYLEVSHTAIENQTTAFTSLRIGVKQGTDFHPLEEELAPAEDEMFWTRSKFLVLAGERLCCRFTGCTTGDVLTAIVQGYLYRGSNR